MKYRKVGNFRVGQQGKNMDSGLIVEDEDGVKMEVGFDTMEPEEAGSLVQGQWTELPMLDHYREHLAN